MYGRNYFSKMNFIVLKNEFQGFTSTCGCLKKYVNQYSVASKTIKQSKLTYLLFYSLGMLSSDAATVANALQNTATRNIIYPRCHFCTYLSIVQIYSEICKMEQSTLIVLQFTSGQTYVILQMAEGSKSNQFFGHSLASKGCGNVQGSISVLTCEKNARVKRRFKRWRASRQTP